MREVTLTLPRLHPKQSLIRAQAARFNVLSCGRRFGKDILGHEFLLNPALDGKPVAWFTPTYRMMLDTLKEISNLCVDISTSVNRSDHRIELITGGVIDFWSLDSPDVARGRRYARVIINEAAMVTGLLDTWQRVIRPTLADYEGDAFFLSTPRGFNGFRTLYQRGLEGGDWKSWHFPTSDNPHIKAAEIEAMRLELPERSYRQEILAEFLEDGGGVFRGVRAAATGQVLPRDPAHSYVIGVDWARSGDFSVFTVMDSITKSVVYVDRFTDVSYPVQAQRLKALYERYRPSVIIAESNSMGAPVIETLQRDGMPVRAFNTSNASKAQIIDGLALAFERQQITILNDEVCIVELEAYESKRTPTGAVSYNAPSGMHDDTVMSLALCFSAVNNATMKDYGWD